MSLVELFQRAQGAKNDRVQQKRKKRKAPVKPPVVFPARIGSLTEGGRKTVTVTRERGEAARKRRRARTKAAREARGDNDVEKGESVAPGDSDPEGEDDMYGDRLDEYVEGDGFLVDDAEAVVYDEDRLREDRVLQKQRALRRRRARRQKEDRLLRKLEKRIKARKIGGSPSSSGSSDSDSGSESDSLSFPLTQASYHSSEDEQASRDEDHEENAKVYASSSSSSSSRPTSTSTSTLELRTKSLRTKTQTAASQGFPHSQRKPQHQQVVSPPPPSDTKAISDTKDPITSPRASVIYHQTAAAIVRAAPKCGDAIKPKDLVPHMPEAFHRVTRLLRNKLNRIRRVFPLFEQLGIVTLQQQPLRITVLKGTLSRCRQIAGIMAFDTRTPSNSSIAGIPAEAFASPDKVSDSSQLYHMYQTLVKQREAFGRLVSTIGITFSLSIGAPADLVGTEMTPVVLRAVQREMALQRRYMAQICGGVKRSILPSYRTVGAALEAGMKMSDEVAHLKTVVQELRQEVDRLRPTNINYVGYEGAFDLETQATTQDSPPPSPSSTSSMGTSAEKEG